MIKDRFLELIGRFKDYGDSYRIKLDTLNQAPIYIGVSKKKNPMFLFDVPEYYPDYTLRLNETTGYRCFIDKVFPNSSRYGIEAASESSFDVFCIVVDDLILIASSQEETPSLAIISRLLLWEEFFKHASDGVIDYKLQIGLIGELLFIEEELQKGNKSIIACWSGPQKGVKDFVINNNAVEVKTSTVSATNRINISDENQLDNSGFIHLFLNVRFLVQNQMDGRSMPEIIDDVSMLISDDSSMTTVFNEKLMHVGYREEFRDRYESRFELSDIYWYEVKDFEFERFPRIIPSDLRNGVKFAKYQIELSMMGPFSIDNQRMRSLLEEDYCND